MSKVVIDFFPHDRTKARLFLLQQQVVYIVRATKEEARAAYDALEALGTDTELVACVMAHPTRRRWNEHTLEIFPNNAICVASDLQENHNLAILGEGNDLPIALAKTAAFFAQLETAEECEQPKNALLERVAETVRDTRSMDFRGMRRQVSKLAAEANPLQR